MNTMFSTHAIRLAYGRTLMDGGSSLLTSDGYDFEVPYKGFMVGGVAGETKIPLDICDSNTFHVSEKLTDSRSAYDLCKERNEDAYYDVEASKSVFIEKDNDNA